MRLRLLHSLGASPFKLAVAENEASKGQHLHRHFSLFFFVQITPPKVVPCISENILYYTCVAELFFSVTYNMAGCDGFYEE
jgi:hypothetical protein